MALSVPSSKSYTQRALILAALSTGRSTVVSPLDCDDSRVLVDALTSMGVCVTRGDDALVVDPGALHAPAGGSVHLGNAGTAVRFVTSLSLLIDSPLTVDGVEAMRRRPMAGLLEALRALGVDVEELGRAGCPPVRLIRTAPSPKKTVRLDPAGSSQQLSSLILVAPRLDQGLTIELVGELPSRPYVEMTLEALRRFGGRGEWTSDRTIEIHAGGLRGTKYVVEGDHSAAAMVLAAGWIAGRSVEIDNTEADSLQGDRIFAQVLRALDRPGPREIDLGDAPDVVPPAVAAALFAQGGTRIVNVAHLRIKESDRMAVLARELAKVGARIDVGRDSMTVTPDSALGGEATLDPHGDHRMAMAFGLVSLRVPGIEVLDPGCVSKSYPDFWSVLEAFR